MLIVPDNDVEGAVSALHRFMRASEWSEYSAALELRFAPFEILGLPRDASDRLVWQTCREADAILLTGNRTGGDESLERIIREMGDQKDLPVITIADPRRILRDPEYLERCAIHLLDLLERIDSLRGTQRLFVP